MPRQSHRSILGDIHRSPRAVDRKGDVDPVLHAFNHFRQRPACPERRGTSCSAVPETLNKAGDVFPVAAPARHYNNAALSPEPCGRENARVPKREYGAPPSFVNRLQMVVSSDFPPDGGPKYEYGNVEEKISTSNQEPGPPSVTR